jgi:hypothetical protein
MKPSFLITLLALAVAIPAAALASGGEGTRIALKPAKAFPAAKGSAKFKARAGERELQVEVEHIRRLAGRQSCSSSAVRSLGPRRSPPSAQRGSTATASAANGFRRSRRGHS